MAIKVEGEAVISVNGKDAGQKLKKLETQARDLRKQLTEVRKQPLIDKAKEKQLKKALDTANKDMKELKGNTQDVGKVLNDLSGSSLEDLNKAYRKLNREAKKLNRNTDEFAKKKNQIKAIKSEIDNTRKSMRAAGNQQSKWGGMVDNLKNSASSLLPAFGFAAIASGAVMVAKKVFDMSKEVVNARKQAKQLTGLTGKELADLTSEIRATAETFGKDFNETLVAANNFAKTMGISVNDAIDKINIGFAAGADVSGEFLDQLKEYGPQFKSAGLSAGEAISIMTQSVKEGVYSDKGADAIKEAALSLREMNKSADDALKAIGLSGKDIQKQLSDGSITTFEAIQKVSRRLGELPPQSAAVGKAIADIFKGAGEDAGLDFITLLGEVNLSYDELIKKAEETGDSQLKLLAANEKLNKAFDELIGTGTGFFDSITVAAKVFVADGLLWIVENGRKVSAFFQDLWQDSTAFRVTLQTIVGLFKTAWEVSMAFFKTLGNGFKTIAKVGRAILKGQIFSIGDIVNEGLVKQKDIFVDAGKKVGKAWSEGFGKGAQEELSKKILKQPVKQVKKTTAGTKDPKIPGATTKPSKEDPTTPEEEYKAQLEAIDRFQTEKEIRLKEAALNELITDAELKEALIQQEIDFLMRKKLLAEQSGQDTLQFDKQIVDKELQLSKFQQGEKDKAAKAEKISKESGYQDTAAVLGATSQLFAAFGEENKAATLLKIGLDTASAISSLVAASEANPANAVTFGGAAIAQYISGLARIITNIGAAKKAISQNYEGRYPVTGAQDGKSYNVPYRGNLQTGMLPPGAALFNERGTEAVITAEHLKIPEVQVNYQRILDAVSGVRRPQFAEGRIATTPQPQSTQNTETFDMLSKTVVMLTNELKSLQENGIQAVNDIHAIDKDLGEIRAREANASA